jgi:hypothetical protein
MRYAVVERDGTVSNVIELGGSGRSGGNEGVTLVPSDTANIGDTYDGERFIAPPSNDPPARRLVRRSVIVDRLQAAGKLPAARAALDAADLYTRERWSAREAIYADDPTAIALLQAIGADPEAILAP